MTRKPGKLPKHRRLCQIFGVAISTALRNRFSSLSRFSSSSPSRQLKSYSSIIPCNERKKAAQKRRVRKGETKTTRRIMKSLFIVIAQASDGEEEKCRIKTSSGPLNHHFCSIITRRYDPTMEATMAKSSKSIFAFVSLKGGTFDRSEVILEILNTTTAIERNVTKPNSFLKRRHQ